MGCASGKGAGPLNIFGNKYGQNLAAVQIARERRAEAKRLREEEEERALSEKYGEAAEGGGGTDESRKRKKEESEKDIAQELDQEEKKKARKVRPQLLPGHLTGADGLMKLPIEFKKIKYKPKKGKKRDIVAAAAYTQNLVNAYHSFCEDLFPSLAFEDVLLKIEQLGSKKEIKEGTELPILLMRK